MTQKNWLLGEVNTVKWAVQTKPLRFPGNIKIFREHFRCMECKQQQCACRLRLGEGIRPQLQPQGSAGGSLKVIFPPSDFSLSGGCLRSPSECIQSCTARPAVYNVRNKLLSYPFISNPTLPSFITTLTSSDFSVFLNNP